MNDRKVLVVGDEKNLRESLVELIGSENFAVESAGDGAEALLKIRQTNFACVLLDIRMPRMDRLQLLAKLRAENLTASPVIVLSAFGESSQTIEAMRSGAFDYITKPLDADELLQVLRRAVSQFEQAAKNANKPLDRLSADANFSDGKVKIIGASGAMREVFKQIGCVAATDATVLITGESGTGKELAARTIHENSARANAPFVAVNCGALPENLVESELFGYERGAFTGAAAQKKGRFEAANGGTIFLDEIGEMPLAAQVKLLRVLQERSFERVGGTQSIKVEARVIAATNRNLTGEIEAKTFREDLFYRLNVVSIRLPALGERRGDVPQLAEFFLKRATEKHRLPDKSFSDAALRALLDYDYAGNVREPENVVERAAVASGDGGAILPEHLFNEARKAADESALENNLLDLPFKEAVGKLERALIEKALRDARGNRTEAARRLDINRRLLYDKIKEHAIKD